MECDKIKLENYIIKDFVDENSKVLELGCGSGELLQLLHSEKNADVQGLEINEECIRECIKRGVPVLHGDIESGLSEYSDNSFDYVVLEQTFQELKNADAVIQNALKIGNKVIVSFPNFAYYKSRIQMFFLGKSPVTKTLPYVWYNTPNLHFLSILDFAGYCNDRNIVVEDKKFIAGNRPVNLFPNLFAEIGIFVISKKI